LLADLRKLNSVDCSAGAIAFKVRETNLKVRGPKYFIDFSPGKACRALQA